MVVSCFYSFSTQYRAVRLKSPVNTAWMTKLKISNESVAMLFHPAFCWWHRKKLFRVSLFHFTYQLGWKTFDVKIPTFFSAFHFWSLRRGNKIWFLFVQWLVWLLIESRSGNKMVFISWAKGKRRIVFSSIANSRREKKLPNDGRVHDSTILLWLDIHRRH